MKPTKNHAQLVEIARIWLFKTHPVVLTEIATTGEEPDAIGWHGGVSTLVEVKAYRSDFLADKNKPHRRLDGIGNYRYYLTTEGVIDPDELPPGWGLLVLDKSKVRRVKVASFRDGHDHQHEKRMLTSAIRRIGQMSPAGISIKPYLIETKNRATVTIELAGDPQK